MALALALAVDEVAPAERAPSPAATESASCRWEALPVEVPARSFGAGVFDPAERRLYYYGGIGVTGAASSQVDVIDLAAADLASASVSVASFDGAQPQTRWGHAGVLRPDVDGQPAIYWIGGQGGDHFEPTATPVPPITPRATRTSTPRPT